jgi:hypothetical protein
MSMNVVAPIHGTGFVAVQMGAIARERNQVRHVGVFYTAPSRSRLTGTRSRLGKKPSRLGYMCNTKNISLRCCSFY